MTHSGWVDDVDTHLYSSLHRNTLQVAQRATIGPPASVSLRVIRALASAAVTRKRARLLKCHMFGSTTSPVCVCVCVRASAKPQFRTPPHTHTLTHRCLISAHAHNIHTHTRFQYIRQYCGHCVCILIVGASSLIQCVSRTKARTHILHTIMP